MRFLNRQGVSIFIYDFDLKLNSGFWANVTFSLHILLALLISGEILLHKRDPRSAAGWLGLVWLSPYIGAILYWIFGINRIKRKGALIRKAGLDAIFDQNTEKLSLRLSENVNAYLSLALGIGNVTKNQLVSAEEISIYQGGDEAYCRMLEVIDQAKESVYLQTYIFDRGEVGNTFIAALNRAHKRAVKVRVIVDAIGSKYSLPSSYSKLKELGIPCRKFLPNIYPWQFAFLNLRNHRKILIVDNTIAFTGGMNIRDAHSLKVAPESFTDDLQFEMKGTIVAQLFHVFAVDWEFASGEHLTFNRLLPVDLPGKLFCRVISDGPDIDFEKIKWSILAAITTAKDKVRIATPYFLPDLSIINALCVAALKGVKVMILVPLKSNILLVNWAMMPQFKQMIEKGCQIFFSYKPFDHSKIMIIDDEWSLIGSANWDARSLRLNFEVNVEVYSREFANSLSLIFDRKVSLAKRLSISDLDSRTIWQNIRDNMARLFSPYL